MFEDSINIRILTNKIIQEISSNHFDIQINKFYVNKQYDLFEIKMKKLFKKCKINKIIKYILDNAITLECKDKYGKKPIHYICQYCEPEIIKYIGSKQVDLFCTDNDQYIIFVNIQLPIY